MFGEVFGELGTRTEPRLSRDGTRSRLPGPGVPDAGQDVPTPAANPVFADSSGVSWREPGFHRDGGGRYWPERGGSRDCPKALTAHASSDPPSCCPHTRPEMRGTQGLPVAAAGSIGWQAVQKKFGLVRWRVKCRELFATTVSSFSPGADPSVARSGDHTRNPHEPVTNKRAAPEGSPCARPALCGRPPRGGSYGPRRVQRMINPHSARDPPYSTGTSAAPR